MATLPGVKSTLADVYFSQNDNAFGARRILLVAPANPSTAGETPGYLAEEPTNELYNPTLYRNENDVVADFGYGSPVHVAYSQILRAGGKNVYISATAPHSVADAKAEPSGDYASYTKREYEVIQGLANVDLVLPEVIVLAGYHLNENVTKTGTARVARYGEITAQTCASLLADAYPCIGLISPVDIEAHLDANRGPGAVVNGAGGDVASATNTTLVKTAAGWGIDAHATRIVTITAGTGAGQTRKIVSNTADTLTVAAWTVNPDATSDFEISTPRFTSVYNTTRLTAGNVNEYVADLSYTTAINDVDDDWHVGVPFPIQYSLDYVEGKTAADGPSLSRFLVVPVGEVVTTGQPVDAADGNVHFKVAAAAVAGHIFGTAYKDSITMKRMANTRYIRYRFSKSNLLALIGVKACPVNVDSSLFICTIDGVTAAQDKAGDISHYTRLQTLTICHELIRGSRAIAEKYIGKTAVEGNLDALETELRSYYLDQKQMGAARDIRFLINFVYTEFKLYVDITVIPAGEIREVQLNVGISLR